ncbi:hypothetical protein ACFV3R_29110 [Streptomyces sp. NPDC059740]|uniref:hypothetical protein n=1 Tax=Streptomyces sp. NPDC059740 TaxID=3346926 RepID=UPI0036540882
MQRLPAAAFLVAVVVSATAGCVAVSPSSGAVVAPQRQSPPAASAGPAGPELGTRSFDAIAETSPEAHHARPADRDRAKEPRAGGKGPEPGPAAAPPAPWSHGRHHRLPVVPHRPAAPLHHRAGSPPHAPTGGTRHVTGPAAVPRGSDPCALGRTFGHWSSGSAANRICSGAYGH